MAKRQPLDYKAQFVPGIFRSPEEIEHEREAPGEDRRPQPGEESVVAPTEREARGARTSAPEVERTAERTNGRTNERAKIRHSFDVWQDQLHALAEIQTRRFRTSGVKPKMGELVQEALDAYIRQQQKQATVRTNERSGRMRG